MGTTGGCIYDAELSHSVKNAYDMGHQIASHTWHHWNLTTLNRDQRKCPSSWFSCQHPNLDVLLQFMMRCGASNVRTLPTGTFFAPYSDGYRGSREDNRRLPGHDAPP